MMNKIDLINNLKSKTKEAKVASMHLKKYACFDKFSSSMMLYLAQWSENPEVLQVLACHPQQSIREAVVLNPSTSYKTLHYLLTDNVVVRLVLSYGKLEQEDFYVLAEKFGKEKKPEKAIEDSSNYVQLIKPTRKYHWVNSQSICLLHNHHVGLKAMKNIDIRSFAPFSGNDLNILLDAKKTRIQEIKDNVDLSERAPLTDCMNHVQQHNYKKYQVAEWRKKNKAHELNFNDAEKHLLNYSLEAEGKVLSTDERDQNMVKKEQTARRGSEHSFSSQDKTILKSWLSKVKRDGSRLAKVPSKFKTYKVCLASVKQQGEALQYVPKSMMTQELCLEAIKNSGCALEYVPPEYANYEIYESAVSQSGLALQHVPESLKDESLCFKAVLSNGGGFIHTPKRFVNQKLCDIAVAQLGGLIKEVPLEFLSENLCLEAVREQCGALEHIPEAFRTKAVCIESLKNAHNFKNVPDHLLNEELIMGVAENYGPDYYQTMLLLIPKDKQTEKICMAAVKASGHNLEFVARSLQTESICLTAVKNYGRSIQYVSNRILSESICFAAVNKWAGAIRYVPESFQSVELCLLALKTGAPWEVLQYISKSYLLKHPYLLSKATKDNYPSNSLFEQLMESWMNDDCIDEADIKSCLDNAPSRLKELDVWNK